MLALRIDLLTGRYVATAYNDRRSAEWPPHPARVFSALVATHFEDPPEDVAAEAEALRWLEGQGAPGICAGEAFQRDVVTVFVPVNDATVTRDKAQEALKRLPSPSAGDIAAALAVTPERRVRQPRTFPSVTPTEPVVHLVWPEAPAPHLREALAALAARVVRLGHSSSLVRVSVEDQAPEPNWRPDPEGLADPKEQAVLRVPSPGQLDRLNEDFTLHQSTEPRVLPCDFVKYTDKAAVAEAPVARGCWGQDWIVLRRVGGPRLPSTVAVAVAKAMRAALLKHGPQPAPTFLTGHSAPGVQTEAEHLAVVPLPFVGRDHADGSLQGLALIFPRGASEGERRAALQALGAWEQAARQDDEETPRLRLTLGRAGVLELERVAWTRPPHTLRESTWCRLESGDRPARWWVSVTPVALDRNPGDLASRDPAKARAAWEAACEIVSRACEHVGLPRPAEVDVLPSVPVQGAAKARAFPPFPPEEGRVRRVRVHARLRFDEPVEGPVLLGAGRFFGLGLFRPVED